MTDVTFSANGEDIATLDNEQLDNLANGQLPMPGLQKVATVDMCSLIIGRSQIIEYWELGIWSNLAFVHAAIQYDQKKDKKKDSLFDCDLESFIFRWGGTPDPDTGRVKRLTKKQLLGAIATLEEKELLEIRNSQLSLDLNQ